MGGGWGARPCTRVARKYGGSSPKFNYAGDGRPCGPSRHRLTASLAQVRGVVGPCLGRVDVDKPGAVNPSTMTAFALFVVEEAPSWPEASFRERAWVCPLPPLPLLRAQLTPIPFPCLLVAARRPQVGLDDARHLVRRESMRGLLAPAVEALHAAPAAADGTLRGLALQRLLPTHPSRAEFAAVAVLHPDGEAAEWSRLQRHAAATGKTLPASQTAEAGKDHPRTAVVKLRVGAPQSLAEGAAALASAREVACIMHNDKYRCFSLRLASGLPATAYVTCPAGEDDVEAESWRGGTPRVETAGAYREEGEPRVAEARRTRTGWVANIVAGEAEADRVLLRAEGVDTGFVLLPNMDSGASGPRRYLAIAADGALRTLRDLRGCHLPLLRRLREEGGRALAGISEEPLTPYLHYPPSFAWLHVHWAPVHRLSARDHLLDAVIANLEQDAEFYAKCALTYIAE